MTTKLRFTVFASPLLTARAPLTKSHDDYATLDFGTLEIKPAGLQTIKVRSGDASAWKPINQRTVLLQSERAQ